VYFLFEHGGAAHFNMAAGKSAGKIKHLRLEWKLIDPGSFNAPAGCR
jgi:hypothetical protein